MKIFLLLVLAVLSGCSVTVNVNTNPYAAQPQYVQPAPVAPVAYTQPVREPRSIKAVQNRALTQQEFRTGDSVAEKEARCGTYRPIDWECK